MMLNTNRGDTLIEVVLALAILSVVLATITTGAVSAWRTSRFAGERTQASMLANEQAEALRAYRQSMDWATFRANFTTTPCNKNNKHMEISSADPPAWILQPNYDHPDIYDVVLVCNYGSSGVSDTASSIDFLVNVSWQTLGSNTTYKSKQYITLTENQ